jgi:hypothetical protein
MRSQLPGKGLTKFNRRVTGTHLARNKLQMPSRSLGHSGRSPKAPHCTPQPRKFNQIPPSLLANRTAANPPTVAPDHRRSGPPKIRTPRRSPAQCGTTPRRPTAGTATCGDLRRPAATCGDLRRSSALPEGQATIEIGFTWRSACFPPALSAGWIAGGRCARGANPSGKDAAEVRTNPPGRASVIAGWASGPLGPRPHSTPTRNPTSRNWPREPPPRHG